MIDARGLVAVALLAVVAHATALGGGYVWLDHAHLEQGLALAAPDELPALFTRGFAGTGFYRPLVALSLSLDALLVREPWFFRAATLAWHALASVMTAVAARKLGASSGAALVAGLFFAVHPATSLVASTIAFRSESMLLVFLLGLVVAHRARRPVLAGLTLCAAGLTKESGLALGPLFAVVLEIERRRRGASAVEPRDLRLFVAEGAAVAFVAALRLFYAPPFRAAQAALSLDDHVGTRLAAFAKSTRALVAPFEPTVCDAFPVTSTLSFPALLGLASLAGVVALVLVRRGALEALFALSLVPALGFVPLTRFWSPHYLYVPLAFGAVLVARELERRGPFARRAFVFAGAVLLALSLSFGRRYVSDERLFGPEVAAEPACREGHFYLAESARERGDFARAARHYERAATPTSGYLAYVDQQAALQNLGAVYFASGRLGDAERAWSAALGLAEDARDRGELEHNLRVVALLARAR